MNRKKLRNRLIMAYLVATLSLGFGLAVAAYNVGPAPVDSPIGCLIDNGRTYCVVDGQVKRADTCMLPDGSVGTCWEWWEGQ